MEKVAFIDNETYAVYDGAYASGNCKDVNRAEFSYVNAIFTLGAAYMYNYVRSTPPGRNTELYANSSTFSQRPMEAQSGRTGSPSLLSTVSQPSSRTMSPSRLHARVPKHARRRC